METVRVTVRSEKNECNCNSSDIFECRGIVLKENYSRFDLHKALMNTIKEFEYVPELNVIDEVKQ